MLFEIVGIIAFLDSCLHSFEAIAHTRGMLCGFQELNHII